MKHSFTISIMLLMDCFLVIAEPEPIKILNHVDSDSTFAVSELKFSSDGKYLVSAGIGTNTWDINSWEIVKSIQNLGSVIFISNDTSLITVDGAPSEIVLFSLQTGELIHTFVGHDKFVGSGRNTYATIVYGLAISNDNKYLVSFANDQKAILWDIETKNLLHQFSEGNPIGFEISHTTFSPDENLVAFGHSFYSTSTFEKVFDLIDPSISNNNLSSVSFSRSNKYFYSVGGDGYIRIWDWENKRLIIKKEIHSGLFEADITSDDKYIVSVGSGNFVKIVDLDRQNVISEFELPEPGRSHKPTISIHPNGDYFAVGGAEGKIFIYDFQEILASQSQVKEWKDYE